MRTHPRSAWNAQPFISAATAAERIDKLFPTSSLAGPALEKALTYLWDLFIVVVEQIPDWRHPAQLKVTGLIFALCNLPNQRSIDLSGCDWNYGQVTLWKDLPVIDGVLADNVETHRDYLINDDSEEEKQSRVRNLNFQSFAARLTKYGLVDASRLAMYWFRNFLEEDPDYYIEGYDKVGPHLDACILPVNVWLSLAVQRIWDLCEANSGEGALRNGIVPGGKYWTGKEGFSVERWEFWEEKLAQVVVNTEASEETRDLAKSMQEIMDVVD